MTSSIKSWCLTAGGNSIAALIVDYYGEGWGCPWVFHRPQRHSNSSAAQCYIQYIQRLTVKLSVACLEGVDIQLSYSMSPVQCQMGSVELCSWVAVKGYITHPYTTYVVLGKGIIQNIVGG